MPIEAVTLLNRPEPIKECPKCCARPFKSFMRGQVQRSRWFGLRSKYCAIICSECKKVVGYEDGNA
jgi:hypothetical protein